MEKCKGCSNQKIGFIRPDDSVIFCPYCVGAVPFSVKNEQIGLYAFQINMCACHLFDLKKEWRDQYNQQPVEKPVQPGTLVDVFEAIKLMRKGYILLSGDMEHTFISDKVYEKPITGNEWKEISLYIPIGQLGNKDWKVISRGTSITNEDDDFMNIQSTCLKDSDYRYDGWKMVVPFEEAAKALHQGKVVYCIYYKNFMRKKNGLFETSDDLNKWKICDRQAFTQKEALSEWIIL